MTHDYIAGKRYPRGLTRKRQSGEKGVCWSYYDLGKSMLDGGKEEYNKRMAEFKKMGNVC